MLNVLDINCKGNKQYAVDTAKFERTQTYLLRCIWTMIISNKVLIMDANNLLSYSVYWVHEHILSTYLMNNANIRSWIIFIKPTYLSLWCHTWDRTAYAFIVKGYKICQEKHLFVLRISISNIVQLDWMYLWKKS